MKIGKTGEEGGEKRKKELQTGNPEEISVLFEMKCVDSRLVERNLHHIFRWYKRRGEWYEIDKDRAIYAMHVIANLVDGLRRIEHDVSDIKMDCQNILEGLHRNIPNLATTTLKKKSLDQVDSWLVHEIAIMTLPAKMKTTKLLERFNEWADSTCKRHQPVQITAFKDALSPYQMSGMLWKHTNTGNVYCIDFEALRTRFCRDNKIDLDKGNFGEDT